MCMVQVGQRQNSTRSSLVTNYSHSAEMQKQCMTDGKSSSERVWLDREGFGRGLPYCARLAYGANIEVGDGPGGGRGKEGWARGEPSPPSHRGPGTAAVPMTGGRPCRHTTRQEDLGLTTTTREQKLVNWVWEHTGQLVMVFLGGLSSSWARKEEKCASGSYCFLCTPHHAGKTSRCQRNAGPR